MGINSRRGKLQGANRNYITYKRKLIISSIIEIRLWGYFGNYTQLATCEPECALAWKHRIARAVHVVFVSKCSYLPPRFFRPFPYSFMYQCYYLSTVLNSLINLRIFYNF